MTRENSHSRIQSDFTEALARLIDGKPNNPLLAEKAKNGKLRINISSVALESGRSRTLIALENSKYPEVRKAILAVASGNTGERRRANKEKSNERKVIADLERQNRLLASQVAALTEQRDRLLDELSTRSSISRKVTSIK